MPDVAQFVVDENILPFSPGSILSILGEESGGARQALLEKYSGIMEINHSLSRQLVSYQGNKLAPGLRWLKYREGFSDSLIRHLFATAGWGKGHRILDPFSGIGTTAMRASLDGEGTGIELMPVGITVTRAIASLSVMSLSELKTLRKEILSCFRRKPKEKFFFNHVPISQGAFSDVCESQIACYRELEERSTENNRHLLRTLALAVLEEVSFTRKDGQYLRWDSRSGRSKARLNKGPLLDFATAISLRIEQVIEDLPRIHEVCKPSQVRLIQGSSLERMPMLPSNYFDGVVTSPPYANRYDYTRTYALELAYCDYSNEDIKALRQTLLSATVENRSKVETLAKLFNDLGRGGDIHRIMAQVNSNGALNEVLNCLTRSGARGDLSNLNVISLVRNYFIEMAVIISEIARVLKVGGKVFMVNDNVQYAGEEVPVDLILSSLAEQNSMSIEKIWMLAKGKGNASQQMGKYGRREIRKCVYVWEKNS